MPAVTVFLVNSEQWHTHRHSLLIHTSMPIYATIPYTPLFGLSAIGAVAWLRKKRRKCATMLNFDLNLGVPFVVQVWMPDTFFRNEKEGKFHDIIQPNLYVRVFPNGDVLYSIRVGMTTYGPTYVYDIGKTYRSCDTVCTYLSCSMYVTSAWALTMSCFQMPDWHTI